MFKMTLKQVEKIKKIKKIKPSTTISEREFFKKVKNIEMIYAFSVCKKKA